MLFIRGRNILPMLAGFLAFQVSGWLMGKKVFESINSEAMLFTFLLGGILLLQWLYFKLDTTSTHPSYMGRTIWISSIVLGVFLGIYMRTQM